MVVLFGHRPQKQRFNPLFGGKAFSSRNPNQFLPLGHARHINFRFFRSHSASAKRMYKYQKQSYEIWGKMRLAERSETPRLLIMHWCLKIADAWSPSRCPCLLRISRWLQYNDNFDQRTQRRRQIANMRIVEVIIDVLASCHAFRDSANNNRGLNRTLCEQ